MILKKKKRLWNLADRKEEIIEKKSDSFLKDELDRIVSHLQLLCWKIQSKFQQHVEDAGRHDPRALDLICFYGTFYPVKNPRASRKSERAVSDSSDCSSSVVGNTLDAAKIHYNMFQDKQALSFQRFKRFEMGGKRTQDSNDNTEALLKNLI